MVKLALFLVVVSALGFFVISRRVALAKFFTEVKFEMAKVTWPGSEEVINTTTMVGIMVIILSIICLITDSVFATVFRAAF